MTKYSKAEIAMFQHFGLHYLIAHLTPRDLYQIATEQAFRDNLQGPAVASLRRCMQAIDAGDIMRLTPAWDELIELRTDAVEEPPSAKEVRDLKRELLDVMAEAEAQQASAHKWHKRFEDTVRQREALADFIRANGHAEESIQAVLQKIDAQIAKGQA